MKKLTLILAAALICAAPATASTRHHALRCHAGYVKRTVRVRERRHGKRATVNVTRCVKKAASKATSSPAPSTTPTPTTTSAPAPAPVPAPAASIAPQTVRAGIDPSYTQDPADNLKTTWTYSASSPTSPLPAGTLALAVAKPNNGQNVGGCIMNVNATTTGGTCTVNLPAYGAYQVTVTYSDSDVTVAPATSTDTETIEPMPATEAMKWGTDQPTASPQVSALVIGSTASVKVTDQNYEGATSLPITDNLGDTCTATISGTSASCSMPVTGTPSSFTLNYPGGTSTQSTRAVAPGGTQQVTTNWPAQNVSVNNPSITVQQATVEECGGQQQGVAWYANGQTPGCGPNPQQGGGNQVVSGQWPNPVTLGVGQWVVFDAAAIGNVPGDQYALGYLTFNVTGPAAPSMAYDEDYGSTPPGGHDSAASQDCSQVMNAAWPQQAVGGCGLEFSTPGTYTLRVAYHSEDPQYGDAVQGYTETINVQ